MIISISKTTVAQISSVKVIDKSRFLDQHVQLKKNGVNKIIPKDYELQTLAALLYYPELQNTHIEFRFKNINTSMCTRPKWDFIFRKRENRRYIIYIDNKLASNNGLLLSQIPFNAQIGIIGHELAHIVDFSKKSDLTLMGNGIGYFFSLRFRQKMEYATDSLTIDHGLGWQLHDFSDFVLYRSTASDTYRNYKKMIYMSPEEILKRIQHQPNRYTRLPKVRTTKVRF